MFKMNKISTKLVYFDLKIKRYDEKIPLNFMSDKFPVSVFTG
jgi:hypothetical protein